MNKTIAVIRGDGIGPEIVDRGPAGSGRGGREVRPHLHLCGGRPWAATPSTPSASPCRIPVWRPAWTADSVLLGAVGGPKWDDQSTPQSVRRQGLLGLRAGMRPLRQPPPRQDVPRAVSDACPLRADIADRGIDFMVVRELIGGVYFGEHTHRGSERRAGGHRHDGLLRA